MEQRDVTTMNSHSENNSSPPLYGPSPSLSDSILSNKAETSTLNPSENPILEPTDNPRSDEAQTSSSTTSNPPLISSPSLAIESSQSQPQPPNEYGVSNPKSASDYNDDEDDDEIPISSMSNPGTATQNPPVQVMDRGGAEEPGTPSAYRIPSHVFDRSKSNTPEWSTASNESLFSIHVGNMSFSRELNWVNEMNISSPLPPPPQQQPPPPNQSPMNNKFNDISQSAKEIDEGLEAKAAETMREVIMETTTEHENCDLTSVSVTARDRDGAGAGAGAGCGGFTNFHDNSRHSDGSTKSFAFKVRTDGDKSPTRSPKGVKEKPMQEMQTMTDSETPTGTATETETEIPKETPRNTAQTPKAATSNASPACRNWLCCFPCCK
ncbi:chitinase-like protein PB1E7.04c [Senna tora]|uniref:Chitinase-like protein PB1E7.04c n=1 Tax=Senna tora TaxID=362788 RepID=A0A834SZD9_9FABA|nr:chitinase-like protein PB1E7.04c [Senna tora]